MERPPSAFAAAFNTATLPYGSLPPSHTMGGPPEEVDEQEDGGLELTTSWFDGLVLDDGIASLARNLPQDEHPWVLDEANGPLGLTPESPSPRPGARTAPAVRQQPQVQPAVAPLQRAPPGPPTGPLPLGLAPAPAVAPAPAAAPAPAPALVREASFTKAAAPAPLGTYPEANPEAAGHRFGLHQLGQSVSGVPCPVLTWVAATVHCIAADPEISGGDDSLTGLTMSTAVLEGGTGSETGLKLRFNQLMGPKGDLICRIARKVMEIMGKSKKEGMFKDWEALRKHLTEDKGLEPAEGKKIEHFSFLWTGTSRGGNYDKDHSQTYFERRYTPDLDDEDKFDAASRKADRKAGGGGNPGLLAWCGFLLQRDHPGVYARAKEAALADIAHGLQVSAFEERCAEQHKVERDARSAAAVKPPETRAQKKRHTKILADSRLAVEYIRIAQMVQKHPVMMRWAEAHPEAMARSYLAAQQFTAVQIAVIEGVFRDQSEPFTLNAVRGLIMQHSLPGFRKMILARSPVAEMPSPPAAPSPTLQAEGTTTATNLGLSFAEAAGATSSASSSGSLTRQRSANSENDSDHREKRSVLAKMSSKGEEVPVTTAVPV